MLLKITESANGQSYPPYSFDYKTTYESSGNPLLLPDRDAKEYSDYWGYYIGATEGQDKVPATIYTDPDVGYELHFEGADRRSNAVVADGEPMQANILTSITYPDGGMASFTYEANTIYDVDSAKNLVVGGVRILQSKFYDGLDHSRDIVKNYAYYQPGNPSLSSGTIGAIGTNDGFPSFIRRRL